MRAIDADAFDERVRAAGGMSEEELTEDFKDGVQAVLYMLSNQPTIQPGIVRCKDCEHGVLDDGFPHQYFCVFKGDEWNNADYYCGHAKRREVTT